MSSSALNDDVNRGEAGSDAAPDLAELAAAIARISALFAGDAGHGLDASAAIERIADIAFVLHERDVEPSLCDALDAAVREISQADAARQLSAQRSQQAIALLGEVSRRIAAMAAQAQAAKAAKAAKAAEAGALRLVAEPEEPRLSAAAERPGGSSSGLADGLASAAPDEPRSAPALERPPEPPEAATGEAEPALAQPTAVEGEAEAALPVTGAAVAEPPPASSPAPAPASASDDPLAAVDALSEAEKIALFS